MVPGPCLQGAVYRGVGKWLKTPLGWARANVFYEKLSSPPKPGSLEEVLCWVVWKEREKIGVARDKAQAQAALGGDAAVEAFTQYQQLVNRVQVEDSRKKMQAAMEDLAKIKEIRFAPLSPMKRVKALRSVDSSTYVAKAADPGPTRKLKPLSKKTRRGTR